MSKKYIVNGNEIESFINYCDFRSKPFHSDDNLTAYHGYLDLVSDKKLTFYEIEKLCDLIQHCFNDYDKDVDDLYKENQRLLELCMYTLISSTKLYNHELANDTKQAFMKIIKENINDDTYMLRCRILNYWNDDK